MKSFYLFNSRILSHIIFWIGILFIYTFFPYIYRGNFAAILKTNLLFLPQDIIAVYFVLYVLFPKYLIPFKFVRFILFSILTILFLTLISVFVSYYILPSTELYYTNRSVEEQFANSLIILFSITGMAATIKYVRLNLIHQFQRKDILMQQMETELKYLKNQINPHFLFNSLNNIDELIFTDQEKASNAIFHLSEILRYVLKETESNTVSLSNEISFIKNYIEFVSYSFKSKKFISFKIEGNYKSLQIPPLLFLPLIENSVKYVDRKSTIPGIAISFFIDTESIHFKIVNKYTGMIKKQPHGIGLKNLKRRLELIYPDKHSLDIEKTASQFIVNLKISFV